MSLARTERALLADLLTEVGPGRPTLCEGWTTSELLTHLLVRERRVDAALGIFLPPLAGWTARVSAGYRKRPWADQIGLLRSGPPAFSPFGWGCMDDKANSMEMFIHHEDVRRGQPNWQPRRLDQNTREQLIGASTTKLVLRGVSKTGIPLTAHLTDEPGGADRSIVLVPNVERAAGTSAGVAMRGGIADILLWLSGRSAVRIEFDGNAADVGALQAGKRGG